MATGSIPALADIVRATGLLDTQQLAELTGLQSQFTDPKAFARALLERGWLTPFQVNQLLQGKDLSLGQYILLERLGEGRIPSPRCTACGCSSISCVMSSRERT